MIDIPNPHFYPASQQMRRLHPTLSTANLSTGKERKAIERKQRDATDGNRMYVVGKEAKRQTGQTSPRPVVVALERSGSTRLRAGMAEAEVQSLEPRRQ